MAAGITGNVDYTPWLNTANDSLGIAGFQGTYDVLWVDDDSPQTGAAGRIQEAIDQVIGSTVYVADGTYSAVSLASIVITKDNLALIGQSRDGTIIDAGAWGASAAGWPRGIHVYADNVTIQDLTVQGFTGDGVSTGGYGILFRDYDHDDAGEGYIYYSDGTVDNVRVQNNYSGIYALVHQGLTITDSLIQNNASDGMFIARECDDVTITGNTVLDSGDHGIWVGYDWSAVGPSDNAVISGNTINGAREGGISFVASDTATISGNDISNVQGGGWSVGAISLKDGVSNVTVSGNTIHDNDGLGSGSGRGVGVDGANTNVSLTGNAISDNAGGGVGVMGSASGFSAHDNRITGNTGYGADNSTGTPLDFEENWWGCPCGPSGEGPGNGDAVSTNVDYSPWWADAAMTITASEGAGGELVIPVGATTAQIQAVFDCAEGATVIFENGAYPGGIVVDTPNTTINLNGSTFGPGSPAFTINAANVTILGPGTLNGDPTATGTNSSDPAVLVNAGADNFTLKDVEVLNWEDGVQIAGDVTSLKVIGNYIHDNTDAGLQVDASVAIDGIVTVEGNLFKANGTGIRNDGANSLPAQYNSWGALSGPASGDTAGATAVDTTDYTFAEVFMDVEPDTEATQRDVAETQTFEVALKVDAENLLGSGVPRDIRHEHVDAEQHDVGE